MKKILVLILFLLFCAGSSFAFSKKPYLNLKTYWLIVPEVGIGLPVNKKDSLEFSYSRYVFSKDDTYSLTYAVGLNDWGQSKDSIVFGLTYCQLSAMFEWGQKIPVSTYIVPIFFYKREWLINDNLSSALNIGFPNVIGFGLKFGY